MKLRLSGVFYFTVTQLSSSGKVTMVEHGESASPASHDNLGVLGGLAAASCRGWMAGEIQQYTASKGTAGSWVDYSVGIAMGVGLPQPESSRQ